MFRRFKLRLKENVLKNYFRYLFFVACLTCSVIGWTSAKYVTSLHALSDSARSAKISYTIENEVYAIDDAGGEILQQELVEYHNGNTINLYDDARIKKLKVVYKIRLAAETATQFQIRKDLSHTDYPLRVERVTFSGDGIEPIEGNPTEDIMLQSAIFQPSSAQSSYECTVILIPDTGGTEWYINLHPSIEQID